MKRSKNPKKPPNYTKHVLLAVSSLVIVVLLARAVKWDALLDTFASARLGPLLVAFVLTLVFPLLNTTRWLAVLHACGVRMSLGRAFRITMACWPVGTLTPGKAGELLKAVAVKDRTLGIGCVLAERVIDVAVLGVYGTVMGLIVGNRWAVLGGLLGLCAAGGVLLGAHTVASLLGEKPLAQKLRGFLLVFPKLRRRPEYLWACVASSALNWFLSMAQLWFLLLAFGAGETSLALIVAILPAATFVGLLPISIAGAGTRDAALLSLAVGAIPQAPMLASSIVYTFLGYFMLGAAGLPFLAELTKGAEGEEGRS